MSKNATTLEEAVSFPFIRERIGSLANAILHEPDDTVLWIGAGLSAKYGALPTWTHFLENLLNRKVSRHSRDFRLIKELIDTGRLAIAAECLQDVIGTELFQHLIETFGKPRGHLPEQLAYLSVRDIITTNYDNLLEQVLPWYETISPSEGMEKLISNKFKIVKIHGSVSDPKSCVLSLSTYVRAYNVNLHWYLNTVFSSCTVVFLGSSMNSSEPFFRVLRLLQANSRTRRRHFAIMAVGDDEGGKREGKRLQKFGIDLIPYIPNDEHSFIEEIFSYLDSKRGSSEAVQQRLKTVRAHLVAKRNFHAAVYLWHTCHAEIHSSSDRRSLGDTASEFFNKALGNPRESADLVKKCGDCGIDLAQLWQRMADLLLPSRKSVHGLRQSLTSIQKATVNSYPQLSRRLTEIEQQIAGKKK